MTNKQLSPAAQAVLDAYIDAPCCTPWWVWLACALRAAADQVAPSDAMEPRNNIPMAIE